MTLETNVRESTLLLCLYSQFLDWLIYLQEFYSMLGTKSLPKGAGSCRTMLLFRAMLLSTSCRVGQSTSDATAPAHQTSESSTTMTDVSASVSVLDKNLICYNDR